MEIVVSKVEPLEMAKREKGAIGMDGTLKATASEVDSNDMTCHRITDFRQVVVEFGRTINYEERWSNEGNRRDRRDLDGEMVASEIGETWTARHGGVLALDTGDVDGSCAVSGELASRGLTHAACASGHLAWSLLFEVVECVL
ncbi:hypothetical protein SO802_010708 [Lithocarpus litseifolius]|uniref:Uncharacterized protein n=1 Tax=Lithocarpus litseifolius TaxID=425828 RepID=A0AAW2DFJ8_9ROSI